MEPSSQASQASQAPQQPGARPKGKPLDVSHLEAAPFDFAAAAALREKRAKELLAAEEARNAAAAPPPAPQPVPALRQQQQPGGSNVLGVQQLLYDGIVRAFRSSGATLLKPPVIETKEGTLAYVVRAREGLDLYELSLSSQRHFVLMRAAKSTGAFGPTGLVAGNGLAAATDTSIPMIGQTQTLMLDINRYVVTLESGALSLVNEALLLANLNENILAKYGLHATSVHAPAPGALGAEGVAAFLRRNATTLVVVAAVAAAAAVAVARGRQRR